MLYLLYRKNSVITLTYEQLNKLRRTIHIDEKDLFVIR